MWKSIKNVVSVAKDLVVIASKEIMHQSTKASSATNNATEKLAAKTHELRENYEVNLATRKESVDSDIIIVKR